MDYLNNFIQKAFSAGQSELQAWRKSYTNQDVEAPELSLDNHKMDEVFSRLVQRLKKNYPFHAACYAGQMLKPPHPAAWAAYSLTSTVNPNNHALDGGPPTSEMEKEVVGKLAAMFGYRSDSLGHLAGGGTMANLEALWVARHLHPDKAVAFSAQAHYTHGRMCDLLGLKSVRIPCSIFGEWDWDYVKKKWPEIGTLVVTMGTTGLGRVEPLHQLLADAQKHGVRIHVDAAYGGYFKLIENHPDIDRAPWSILHEADSIVIDPHKHGMQPYGCGCILFKDAGIGRFYKHDSPYTYFTSDELHLGEISLECSRPGAAAAALWTTLELFPLEPDNGFGPIMAACRSAALDLFEKLSESNCFEPVQKPDLDIVGYYPLNPNDKRITTSQISAHSKAIFQNGMHNKDKPLYLSLLKIPSSDLIQKNPAIRKDSNQVTVLRSVMMKPEHQSFVPEMVNRLESLAWGL